MVGASPVVTKVTVETTTLPDTTVNAGVPGSTVVGSWSPAALLMYSVIPVGTLTVWPEYVPDASFRYTLTDWPSGTVTCSMTDTTSSAVPGVAWIVTDP